MDLVEQAGVRLVGPVRRSLQMRRDKAIRQSKANRQSKAKRHSKANRQSKPCSNATFPASVSLLSTDSCPLYFHMHFPLGHGNFFTIITPVPLTTYSPRQPSQTITMEGVGAAAGLLQVLEYLMRLSRKVRSVYKQIKDIKQTTDDFGNDIRLMGITMAAMNSELRTFLSSNPRLPDWLNVKELQTTFDSANGMLLSLNDILVDIKDQNQLRQGRTAARLQMYRDWKTYAPKINHHQSRITLFVNMMNIPMMFLKM